MNFSKKNIIVNKKNTKNTLISFLQIGLIYKFMTNLRDKIKKLSSVV